MARRIALMRNRYRPIEGAARTVLLNEDGVRCLARMCPHGREDAERALVILAHLPLDLGDEPYRVIEAVNWLFFCLPNHADDARLAIYDMVPAHALRASLEGQDHHHHKDVDGAPLWRSGRWRQAGAG